MKRDKIIFWLITGILSIRMLTQAVAFIFNSENLVEMFTDLGVPVSLIIPIGIAKLLAILAIVSRISPLLKKLAYYGLALEIFLALGSHLRVGDGDYLMPSLALLLVIISFVYDRKIQ